jgi:phosphoribosyl-dephospho-CoA transferase
MHTLQRNQLVWLTGSAWEALLTRASDAQTTDLLRHWHVHHLPLVVCRQRAGAVDGGASLGLPAPAQWNRRKLALEAMPGDVAKVGHFPLLRQISWDASDAEQLGSLLQHMEALGVALQVYGSYGWQHISALPCVRGASDLDLLAPVPDLATAAQVTWLLQGLALHCRVDGEIVFPNGWAVAWREYAQLIGGSVAQVLVKDRAGVQLLDMAALRRALRPLRPERQPCTTA